MGTTSVLPDESKQTPAVPPELRAAIEQLFSDLDASVVAALLPTRDELPPVAEYERVLLSIVRLSEGKADRLEPVSYTHLDVYKRQVDVLAVGADGHGVRLCCRTQADLLVFDARGDVDHLHGVVALLGDEGLDVECEVRSGGNGGGGGRK